MQLTSSKPLCVFVDAIHVIRDTFDLMFYTVNDILIKTFTETEDYLGRLWRAAGRDLEIHISPLNPCHKPFTHYHHMYGRHSNEMR